MLQVFTLTIIFIQFLDNKTNLSGVNDFMNHFVALPCGWWFNLENK